MLVHYFLFPVLALEVLGFGEFFDVTLLHDIASSPSHCFAPETRALEIGRVGSEVLRRI